MPTLKIDGQEVTVDPGTTVLEAASQLGIEIPSFCYHPGLTNPANCRMCLVEMSTNGRPAPKPQPACYVSASDNMEVDTCSEHVKQTRRSVLEFILLNHPVDCPICDQAGECVLQDHYFRYSAQASRLTMPKVHKAKAKPLGPKVMLDAERCILCTRCIRFCDEVAGEPQLTIVQRGEHSELTTFPGAELDNDYAFNTVDICPVGALTSRDFRFRTRVWYMESSESVCPDCSRGCRIRVDTHSNVVRRFKPMHNPKVNGWWMCDDGRTAWKRFYEDRIEGPSTTASGARKVTGVSDAVEAAAAAIEDARTRDAGIAVVVTPWFTNEDAYLVGKLLSGSLSGATVYFGGRPQGEGDDILRQADANPNATGTRAVLEALGVTVHPVADLALDTVSVAVIFGDEHGLTDDQMQALEGVDSRIVFGTMMSPLWQASTVFLPTRVPVEKDGSFTNFEGVVQRIERAVTPSRTCKSDGWYAMKLAQTLGQDVSFGTPEAVFCAIAEAVPGFNGMRWQALRPTGLVLGEAAAQTAPPVAPTAPVGGTP